MTLINAPSSIILRAGVLLLVTLLLTPLAVQAQGIANVSLTQGKGLYVNAVVTLTGGASHYPATVTVTWGDGSSNYGTARNTDDNAKTLWHTYANCGVKSISLTASFNGGASQSRSIEFTVACKPAQEPEGGPGHCFADGCRQVPEYFLENQRAVKRYIRDLNERAKRGDYSRRSVFDFGYRCPDAMGRCPTAWIPGSGTTRGLSSPNRYAGSPGGQGIGGNVQRIRRRRHRREMDCRPEPDRRGRRLGGGRGRRRRGLLQGQGRATDLPRCEDQPARPVGAVDHREGRPDLRDHARSRLGRLPAAGGLKGMQLRHSWEQGGLWVFLPACSALLPLP